MDALIQQAIDLAKQGRYSYTPIPGRIAYLVNHGRNGVGTTYDVDRTQGVAIALQECGLKVYCLGHPGRIQSLEAAVAQLEEALRSCCPEKILAASDPTVGLPAWIVAQQLQLPLYVEVRTFPELERDAREPGYADTQSFEADVERSTFVVRQAEKVFTLSTTMKDELARRGVEQDRIELAPLGVKGLPDTKSPDPAMKDRFGVKPGTKVIGCDCRSSHFDDLDIVVEACAALVAQGDDIRLILIGDDSAVTRAMGKASAISERSWLMQVRELPEEYLVEFYAMIDVLVIPRKPLPVCELVPPMKAIEALAYGKRVVVSNVAALTECGDKYDGVLTFDAGKVESLAKILKESLTLPSIKPGDQLLLTAQINPIVRSMVGMAGKKESKAVKAIYIMDEISEECWKHELKSFRIKRHGYQRQVEISTAAFAFLESCWNANGGAWQYAFTSPGLKHANAQALLDAIARIKERGLPLVFWNKEDPMHYDRYLPISSQADIIFTTDSNKIPDYRRDAPGANVYAMPFAAQQKICNPSGRFSVAPETVCFAGSYYGTGHDERKRQMDALLPSIVEFNGAIYDRFSNLGDEKYKYPERYQPYIRDAVPFRKVVSLYKQFKVFLNVNTIVDSPTMMSRRVYELLACGTPVVSAPSRAIEEQFAGIVHTAGDDAEAGRIIEKLLTDDLYWDRSSHLGYREVMTRHTYTHRLQLIKQALGGDACEDCPLVSIITCTRRPGMIDRIVENMRRQVHPNCELILMLQDFDDIQRNELLGKLRSVKSNLKRIEVLVNDSRDITLGERFNHAATYAKGEYIAKMDDDDFYFEHYLSDMLIPFTFGDYGMVGKKDLYMFLSGSNKLVRRCSGYRHRIADFVAGPTFVIKKKVFDQIKFEARNTGEDSSFIRNVKSAGYLIYAADPFNFIQFRADPSKHTWVASDEEILRGADTRHVADHQRDELVRF